MSQSSVLCQAVQVRGLLLPSPRSLVIPWPTPLAHSFTDDGHVYLPKISCRSKKIHRQPSWMEASLWPCRTSDKSSEVWGMAWTCNWRGYERKAVEYLTKEQPDFSWQVCDPHEVKPNRKLDLVRGLADRNFRTVRPRFSIQFSISSPVIVRNRRIEPKFGLLNLSNEANSLNSLTE